MLSLRAREDVAETLGITSQVVRAHLADLLGERRLRAAVLAGSLAEGFGNSRSDVDVVAIADGAKGLPRLLHRKLAGRVGIAIQYELVDAQELERMTQRIEAALPHADSMLGQTQNQLLHRLCNSITLLGDEDIDAFRHRLRDGGYPRYAAYVKNLQAENALEDAYGNWEGGQWETAVFNSRLAAHRAFEAVLARLGRTGTNEKWVFEKAAAALGRDHALYRAFARLYLDLPRDFLPPHVTPYLEALLGFMQQCVEIATAFDVDDVAPSHMPDGSLAGELIGRFARAGAARRSPHVLLRRCDGKYIAFDRQVAKRELSERVAVTWLLLGTCADVDAAVTRAAALRPDLFHGVDDVSPLAATLLRSWRQCGMLPE